MNAVSLLNLHEDERSKPAAWIPIGWIPVYNEERDQRPLRGYESTSARKHRLYHSCWVELLDGWAERTKESMVLPWADGVSRWTRFFLGGMLCDQQEGNRYTREPCVCHRCGATRDDFLKDDTLQPKSMKRMRSRIETYAAGANLRGARKDRVVVKWDPDGRNVRPGPGTRTNSLTLILSLTSLYIGASLYESQRKAAGAHLGFNAFWLIPYFCINMMYMRDSMHQIDHGVIISFLKAILRKYLECIETALNCVGAAAAKLTARLTSLVGKKKSASGHCWSASHSSLVPITHVTARIFQQLYSNKKPSSKIRAADFRHLLLLLPFILDSLFRNEVDAHNRIAGHSEQLVDPSSELVEVANTFLAWYKLYRQITPGKNMEDVAGFTDLGKR